jgi:SAM-dependent methyltransferase
MGGDKLMLPLSQLPQSDPTQIFRFRDRQYAAELMALAVLELRFFEFVDQYGTVTVGSVCEHYRFAERPVDVLLSLCRASGFLEQQAGGSIRLTQVAREYLIPSSPWYLGPYYEPYRNSEVYDGYLRVLKSDKPANWGAKREGDDWHESMRQAEFAKTFTEIMNCRGKVLGQHLAEKTMSLLANKKRLLDVGGGSGIYALTLLARHTEMRGVVLEKAPVDEIARANIKCFGMDNRLQVMAGDMFAIEWPECDIVLLSNVLHDWGMDEVNKLICEGVRCLKSGGVILIHEAFLRDQKDGPLPVAEYSSMLMHITQGKCYAPYEYGDILRKLGCEVLPYQDTLADRGYMAAVKNC